MPHKVISSGFVDLRLFGSLADCAPNLIPDADGPVELAPMSGIIPSSVGITSSWG